MLNLASTGVFLLVPNSSPRSHHLVSQLTAALSPPLNAPFAEQIVTLLDESIFYASKRLEKPTDEVLQLEQDLRGLSNFLKNCQSKGQAGSSALALKGKASTHPVWYQLAQVAANKTGGNPFLLYLGCSVLLSIHTQTAIPRVAAEHLREISEIDLSEAALDSLVCGFSPAEHLAARWTSRLAKMWREVVRIYSGGDVPPPNLRHRITGQLLGTALNPNTAHVSGAQTHRQLSPRQFKEAARHIAQSIEADEFEGVLGVMSVRTGLAVDILVQLPLHTGSGKSGGFFVDPQRGVMVMDLQPLVYQPAQAIAGCHPGGFNLTVHLPECVARLLKTRSDAYRFAPALADLFPAERDIFTTDRLLNNNDEIAPTWARLRTSSAAQLLSTGFNALHAALLTMDFSLIARSKMHYAVVSPAEWHNAETALHTFLGWDQPVSPTENESGLGCRVVPTHQTVVQHDSALVNRVIISHPGKRYTLESLTSFHNNYTLLTGWRLSVLLALRASKALGIRANIQPEQRWAAVHDKTTRNDRGEQPVPLCKFTIETIRLYRQHCAALFRRFTHVGHGCTPPARWALAVSESSDMPLLALIGSNCEMHPLPSHEFCKPLNNSYQLPDDPGRKIMENALRWEGLPAGLIDQMLRHNRIDEVHLGNFNTQPLGVAMTRLTQAVQSIAEQLFKVPTPGLSKE